MGEQGGSPLRDYESRVSAFTETLLRPYLLRLEKTESEGQSYKELNDPVWGTIVLEPHEVVVLDSPLLQRLRRIRQLGVAHFVYPAAVHTRFEHSVGVCHQVGRLAESINTHARQGEVLLELELVRLLRLTGLCHDIGHGLMSHVVENALRDNHDVNAIILAFKKKFKKDGRIQLSEIAAHYMLGSPAFDELLSAAYRRLGVHPPENLAKKMSYIVIGESVGDDFPLLHELISGPFDADKLDYMPRDAAMCGVPVVTDINRLIQKVRAVKLATNELPLEIAGVVGDKHDRHAIVGISTSGASTLDEVALGRSLMFDKIYRHHKVRAAEAMVAAVCHQLSSRICDNIPMLPLSIHDDAFLDLGPADVQEGADVGDGDHSLSIGLDILSRIRERNLFVRGFAFSQHLPQDPYRGDPENRMAIENMIRETSLGESRRAFVGVISQRVSQILDLLGKSDVLKELPGGEPIHYIWVDPPAASIPDAKPDPNRAYLIGSDWEPRRVDQVNAETRGWSDAYVNTHDIGYVFTVRELAPFVFIAAEVASKTEFGLRAPEEARVYSKQSKSELDDLRDALDRKGFYGGLPQELRPLPQILRKGDAAQRLATVCERLYGYQGPIDVTELRNVQESPFNVGRMRDWIKQFGPVHAEGALILLERMMLLGRAETNAALNAFLSSEGGQAHAGGSVCPIGQPKDGAAIVAYHVGDAAKASGCEVRSLTDALSRDEPIVMVDDFIGRGSSTVSILQALLGLADTESLGESRPDALSETTIEEFRKRKIAFVYCAGKADGAQRLREFLTEVGFEDSQVFVSMGDDRLPTLEKATRESLGDRADEFIERCAAIGEELLISSGVDAEKAKGRALGYGNDGLLVVFPYNTPTATVTALWGAGEVSGWPWRPLFPRRKKQ